MPRSISHPFRLVVAVLASALVQLPASDLYADGKQNDEAHDKDKGPKGDKNNAAAGAAVVDTHAVVDIHKGEKQDDFDDESEGTKSDAKKNEGKPEKEHKKSAAEELFGDDNKDEPDPVRLEVHMKGEKVAARVKLEKILEGKPMTEDLRAELQRDALTTAKLLRIRSLARSSKDAPSISKVNALLGKEHERHAEFLASYKAKLGGGK